MRLQSALDYWASRERALFRAEAEFADNNGAPWHSVSCACQQCLDADAMIIGPWSSGVRAEVLFSGVEA